MSAFGPEPSGVTDAGQELALDWGPCLGQPFLMSLALRLRPDPSRTKQGTPAMVQLGRRERPTVKPHPFIGAQAPMAVWARAGHRTLARRRREPAPLPPKQNPHSCHLGPGAPPLSPDPATAGNRRASRDRRLRGAPRISKSLPAAVFCFNGAAVRDRIFAFAVKFRRCPDTPPPLPRPGRDAQSELCHRARYAATVPGQPRSMATGPVCTPRAAGWY